MLVYQRVSWFSEKHLGKKPMKTMNEIPPRLDHGTHGASPSSSRSFNLAALSYLGPIGNPKKNRRNKEWLPEFQPFMKEIFTPIMKQRFASGCLGFQMC